jgi:hypothetical protein
MDPKALLENADQAVSDCELELARDMLANYREWRFRGGFEPIEVAGSGKRGDEFARACERRLESRGFDIY